MSSRDDDDEGKVRAACIRLSLPANELAIGTMLRCFDDALFGDLDSYVLSVVSRSAVVDKDGARRRTHSLRVVFLVPIVFCRCF